MLLFPSMSFSPHLMFLTITLGFSHGSVQESSSLFISLMTNFLDLMRGDCGDHDTNILFSFTSHLLTQYRWFLFLLLAGPSVFHLLPGSAARCSARLCCSCPNYTLVKVGSCLLLESQGASYYLSDRNFFPHEVRGCCSGWALGLLGARRPENQWLPIYSILLNSEFSPMPAVATLPCVSLCCRTPLSQAWGSPGVWQEGSHWRSPHKFIPCLRSTSRIPLAEFCGVRIRSLERKKDCHPFIGRGGVCFEGRGVAGCMFSLEVFRFLLAQGGRLEMRSHPRLFILQFY